MAEAAQETEAKKQENAEECGDYRCPRHGGFKTRGRIFKGTVVSAKAKGNAVVEMPFLRKVAKYERLEKRRSKLHVHVPSCRTVSEGDKVRFMECRKLSKTKSFVLIE
ncbi:MAG: 30S ribosomal protein S17 [Candidatus Micrarchaeota archaeon]